MSKSKVLVVFFREGSSDFLSMFIIRMQHQHHQPTFASSFCRIASRLADAVDAVRSRSAAAAAAAAAAVRPLSCSADVQRMAAAAAAGPPADGSASDSGGDAPDAVPDSASEIVVSRAVFVDSGVIAGGAVGV